MWLNMDIRKYYDILDEGKCILYMKVITELKKNF